MGGERIVLEDPAGVYAPGAPIRGAVEGVGGDVEIVLERRASGDVIVDLVDAVSSVTASDGFELRADDVPTYEGKSVQLVHALVARRRSEELARLPIRIAVPENATMRFAYFGSAAPHDRGTWTGTIVLSVLAATVGLSLIAFAWAKFGGSSPGALAPLSLVGAVALLGVAFYMPWARWREERRGWTGPFVGLAPEPSFSAGLTRAGDPFRLETMYALRNVTLADGYRGGARPALELTVELSPNVSDVQQLFGRLRVVETQRVRVRRAEQSTLPPWEDRDTVVHSKEVELTPDTDAPYLRVGALEVPPGLPPAVHLTDWGGIEWRFTIAARIADGTERDSGWRSLRTELALPDG